MALTLMVYRRPQPRVKMNDVRFSVKCACEMCLIGEVNDAAQGSHSIVCPKCDRQHPLPGRLLWFAYRYAQRGFWTPGRVFREDELIHSDR
jgi:hypothetical protein